MNDLDLCLEVVWVNPWPLGRKSDALTAAPPRHLVFSMLWWRWRC